MPFQQLHAHTFNFQYPSRIFCFVFVLQLITVNKITLFSCNFIHVHVYRGEAIWLGIPKLLRSYLTLKLVATYCQ